MRPIQRICCLLSLRRSLWTKPAVLVIPRRACWVPRHPTDISTMDRAPPPPWTLELSPITVSTTAALPRKQAPQIAYSRWTQLLDLPNPTLPCTTTPPLTWCETMTALRPSRYQYPQCNLGKAGLIYHLGDARPCLSQWLFWTQWYCCTAANLKKIPVVLTSGSMHSKWILECYYRGFFLNFCVKSERATF